MRELTAARFAGGVFCGEVAADLDRLADLSVEPLDHIEVGNALAKTGETPSL